MSNTTPKQDQIVQAAEDFGQRNEAAYPHITALVEVLSALDDELTDARSEIQELRAKFDMQ